MSCFWDLIKQAQAVARENVRQRNMMALECLLLFLRLYYERKYLWKSQQNCDFIIFVAFIIVRLSYDARHGCQWGQKNIFLFHWRKIFELLQTQSEWALKEIFKIFKKLIKNIKNIQKLKFFFKKPLNF
jgi:hypothetical protein